MAKPRRNRPRTIWITEKGQAALAATDEGREVNADERERMIRSLHRAYSALVSWDGVTPETTNALDAVHDAIRTLCPDETEYDRIVRNYEQRTC